MNNLSTKIDFDTWKRQATYKFFQAMPSPLFGVTYKLDVSALIIGDRPPKEFNAKIMHKLMRALNLFEEFKVRKKGNDFLLYQFLQKTQQLISEAA